MGLEPIGMYISFIECKLTLNKDILALDEKNHGYTFCLIILGSNKTTVSVATGQNDYYPLYMSNGLIHNNVRRAHGNGLALISFLAIPKSKLSLLFDSQMNFYANVNKADREHEDSDQF